MADENPIYAKKDPSDAMIAGNTSVKRESSNSRINVKTQLSSSGIIIERRQKSSTDVIRKASNSQLLE